MSEIVNRLLGEAENNIERLVLHLMKEVSGVKSRAGYEAYRVKRRLGGESSWEIIYDEPGKYETVQVSYEDPRFPDNGAVEILFDSVGDSIADVLVSYMSDTVTDYPIFNGRLDFAEITRELLDSWLRDALDYVGG